MQACRRSGSARRIKSNCTRRGRWPTCHRSAAILIHRALCRVQRRGVLMRRLLTEHSALRATAGLGTLILLFAQRTPACPSAAKLKGPVRWSGVVEIGDSEDCGTVGRDLVITSGATINIASGKL